MKFVKLPSGHLVNLERIDTVHVDGDRVYIYFQNRDHAHYVSQVDYWFLVKWLEDAKAI